MMLHKREIRKMSKFHVVVAKCDRYEIEAENEEAAVKQIRDAHYEGDLHAYFYGRRNTEFQDQHIDFFTKFESEGEIVEEEVDDSDLGETTGSPAGEDE
jgi:hypothetical protein